MYIVLDVGTSGTKAALIDREGWVISSCQVSYNYSDTRDGRRVLDGEEIWRAVKICLGTAGAGRQIRTITVASLGEAVLPVDREGRPLYGCITGTDLRGSEELEELEASLGRKMLTEITGLNSSSMYSALKILWLRKHCPGIYEKAWKFLTVQDYVIYRLCGSPVCDYGIASRTLLFDADKKAWSEQILRSSQISREKLSCPVPAGTAAGKLNPSLAEELNFMPDVQVVVGSHDHICNALGCGVYREGECSNAMGTTEGITAVLKREQLPASRAAKYQMACEPFVLPGLCNTVAWNNASGVLLRWFVQEFVREGEQRDQNRIFEQMNSQMEEEPTHLLILPHFSGAATPYMDNGSKGAVLGLTLGTRRQDIYKALMESVNFELAQILECLEKAEVPVKRLIATGGALSPQLLQIKADVLGREIYTVENKQTGTLGCAVLGSVAAGDYGSVEEAVKAMVRPGLIYEPQERRSRFYREKFALYKEVYPALAGLSRAL